MLWGAGSVQTYYYFDVSLFPTKDLDLVSCSLLLILLSYKYEDSNWLRAVVTVAWALCTAHTGLILYGAYTYLVTHYGSSEYLGTVNMYVKSLLPCIH